MNKPPTFLTSEEIDQLPWAPFPGSPGMWQRVLSMDEATGSYTRLIRADPGYESPEPVAHDFWEESWILEGSFIEDGRTFGVGTYVCNPPGYQHGPYQTATGWLALELVLYPDVPPVS
jgi:hypothetical protein